VLRRALRDGTVPGAGLALLQCQTALRERLAETTCETERAALRIVANALDAPFRTIMRNCGLEPSAAFAKLATAPAGMGIDAVTGQVVEPREAGIVDPLSVAAAAATTAIRSVALALTIDAIVHTRKTEISVDPE
jgi:chaperonin GroEL